MAHVITIKNENVTLFGMADFEFQVEKHMGHEALEYLLEQKRDIIEGLNEIKAISRSSGVIELVEEILNDLE